MTATDCACDKLERLEGVAIPAYISQFLERSGVDEQNRRTHYVCRRCGRAWIRIEDEVHRKPSLIKQEMGFNV